MDGEFVDNRHYDEAIGVDEDDLVDGGGQAPTADDHDDDEADRAYDETVEADINNPRQSADIPGDPSGPSQRRDMAGTLNGKRRGRDWGLLGSGNATLRLFEFETWCQL